MALKDGVRTNVLVENLIIASNIMAANSIMIFIVNINDIFINYSSKCDMLQN